MLKIHKLHCGTAISYGGSSSLTGSIVHAIDQTFASLWDALLASFVPYRLVFFYGRQPRDSAATDGGMPLW